MRNLLTVVSLLLLAAPGCGDDTTTMTSTDMAIGADMSASPHDMATLSCAQVLSCTSACTTLTCYAGCITSGSTAAQGRFNAFSGCLFAACGTGDGGGTGMCTSNSDTSPTCLACVNSTGTAAATTGNPCNTQFAACAAN